MVTSNNMVTYEDVRVAYDNFIAIPKLNLVINEGEFFTLLGPSGCGKTTALRTLAGFIDPTDGHIIVAGRDVTKLAPDKREIGMVFQNYALFPSLTAGENIAFGLRVKGVPKSEVTQRVTTIAEEVQLSGELLAKSIAAMSGGQQQRVAIARALVTRPKILLLDEPLSNLDAKLRHQLREQLKTLQLQFGITTIYVTHDQEEALTMSDRIAVMNRGVVEQVGTPEDVYHNSSTEFVCTFIGDTNKLSPLILRRLNLTPDKSSYIRVEKISIVGAEPVNGAVPLAGHVISRSFHGMYTTYQVGVGDDELRIVVNGEHGGLRDPGEPIDIGINPADVLQYEVAS